MKLVITVISILSIINLTKGQDIVLFHSYHQTASRWDIEEWNIQDTTEFSYVLKETIDNEGRVKQLEFLEKGKLSGHLCYLANRVTFEYEKNKIIETLYSGDEELLATDCEMHYKTIYHLDIEKYIVKIECYAKYDFSGLDSMEIKQWRKWVPEYSVQIADSSILQVDYYYYSFAKLNGVYPVSKNYILSNDYYYGDEPEKTSIKKGLEKIKN